MATPAQEEELQPLISQTCNSETTKEELVHTEYSKNLNQSWGFAKKNKNIMAADRTQS